MKSSQKQSRLSTPKTVFQKNKYSDLCGRIFLWLPIFFFWSSIFGFIVCILLKSDLIKKIEGQISFLPFIQAKNESISYPVNSRYATPSIEKASKYPQQGSSSQLYYTVKSPTNLYPNDTLQAVVNHVVKQLEKEGLPVDRLSVCLIDIRDKSIAGHQMDAMRYPASLSKLFWMVALYAQQDAGFLAPEDISSKDLTRMIQDSDNEPASRIVDQLTATQSTPIPQPSDYRAWLDRRMWFNRFFERAGYKDINVSQKNFPIPYLGLIEPTGFDKRMQGNNLEQPIRNQITAYQVARLLYEIAEGQAVSSSASRSMLQLLERDLRTNAWQGVEDNAIEGFLGEGLSPDQVEFASKVGFTTQSRQEVALVRSKDGRVAYILAILAEDSAYANDWKIFPAISQDVFTQMSLISSK